MLSEGDEAPDFALPAAVDGEITTVSLSDYAGPNVVVLAFYPADFSPTCTEEMCSLRDMDLFSLQKEVALLGISTDTAFSHRAFADEHGLEFPLLSDNDGAVAEAYGVRHDEAAGGHSGIAKRAVFVVDGARTVRYAWATDDPNRLPDLGEVRTAIDAVADEDTALDRYRVAHEHYRSGRTAFDRGWEAYESEDWLTANDAFGDAVEDFESAVDAFDAAERFAESDAVDEAAERARNQANDRRRAAKWYAESADHYVRGEPELGAEYREDAAGPHQAAEGRAEPPAPDELAE